MVRPSRAVFGQIPKWPTGEDCKSSGFAFTGSNPVLPISPDQQHRLQTLCHGIVTQNPAKLHNGNVYWILEKLRYQFIVPSENKWLTSGLFHETKRSHAS